MTIYFTPYFLMYYVSTKFPVQGAVSVHLFVVSHMLPPCAM